MRKPLSWRTRFGVWMVKAINRLTPQPGTLAEVDEAKLGRAAYQQWEYNEAAKITPEFGPRWDLRQKKVLDVGCGLGGKPVFYAERGPAQIAAVDLRFHSTRTTYELAEERHYPQIQPVHANAACMPFCSDYFDMIISVNVFEHVDELLETLAECKRVLRPGGQIFLHFPPFYSPWGAHLEGWLNFPWPHVFFSDRTLLSAVAEIEVQKTKNSDYIPTAQFQWSELESLPELNRVTARQFLEMIRKVDLQIVEAQMLPFGRHFLLRFGPPGRIARAALMGLARLPILREVVTTKMMFILTKTEAASQLSPQA